MPEKLEYGLEIEERDGYLYVEYSGDPVTLEMVVRWINAVADALRSSGLKRVLLVGNAPVLHSDANRVLVAELIKRSVHQGTKFAIVDKFGNDPEKTVRSVEVHRNAGWDLTGFDSIEEAARWLTST
jgi:hypothetical protein